MCPIPLHTESGSNPVLILCRILYSGSMLRSCIVHTVVHSTHFTGCRLASMAVLHHKRHQLRQCFNMWRKWCRKEVLQREAARKADARKEKMSSLLQAVRRKGEKLPDPQQPAPSLPVSNPQQQSSSPEVSLITSKIVRQELVSYVYSDIVR